MMEFMDIDATERSLIETALAQIEDAKLQIERAKVLENDAKQLLAEKMVHYGWTAFTSPKGEKVEYVGESTSSSLNKQKLRECLLLKGVGIHVIDTCFEAATKVSAKKAYVKYTGSKDSEE